jgi:hypothetical protein
VEKNVWMKGQVTSSEITEWFINGRVTEIDNHLPEIESLMIDDGSCYEWPCPDLRLGELRLKRLQGEVRCRVKRQVDIGIG